jgi:hypothetical protein
LAAPKTPFRWATTKAPPWLDDLIGHCTMCANKGWPTCARSNACNLSRHRRRTVQYLQNLYSKLCSTEQRHTTESCERPRAAAMAHSTLARHIYSFPVAHLNEAPPWLLPGSWSFWQLFAIARRRLKPSSLHSSVCFLPLRLCKASPTTLPLCAARPLGHCFSSPPVQDQNDSQLRENSQASHCN